MFHPYEPLLIAADGRDRLGLWNYEEGEKVAVLVNDNPRGTKITAMHLINDLHVSLILVGSDDGVVRLWRNAHVPGEARLAGAFAAFGKLPRVSPPGLVLDWQQQAARVVAAGPSDVIRLWDVTREQCILETPVTPMSLYAPPPVHDADVYAGAGAGPGVGFPLPSPTAGQVALAALASGGLAPMVTTPSPKLTIAVPTPTPGLSSMLLNPGPGGMHAHCSGRLSASLLPPIFAPHPIACLVVAFLVRARRGGLAQI